MANLCPPLSAGEDTFELHSLQLELEAVEKQIQELLVRQTELREQRAAPESSRMSFTPAPGHHGPWVQQQRKTQARPRLTTMPPPVFEISTRNRFAPLRETECDAVIVGDFIVRTVRALARSSCMRGENDTRLRQTEVLKRDFSSLIETVRSTSPAMRIIVSGPLPTYRRGHERERARLFRADGLHPSRVGAELLSDSISRMLCSI
ncbi:putative E3 ubiquitin-protein ligase HECTD2 [Labeo rohita]|uniref:E3 ubiquitin-protein ligase HECTD2 n=1 Tax=Labeo rohita TaxID=84645 RepID=A0ABQ8MX09_LABRO|nr:putative E3 ubiquitin-protein ligase HECTD2 [Labeo rohita]